MARQWERVDEDTTVRPRFGQDPPPSFSAPSQPRWLSRSTQSGIVRSKDALYVGKASVSRTPSPGLHACLTEHFGSLYRPGLKKASKPLYRLLRRKFSFHWLFFPPPLKLSQLERWRYRWRPRWAMRGMLRKSDACGARERTPSSARLGEGRRVGSSEKGWCCSWRIARKVRTVQTFRRSGCRVYWWDAMWACTSLGAGAAGSSQSGRHKMVAVLQRQTSPPRRSFRGVPALGGRAICRCVGAAEPVCRAGEFGGCRYGSRAPTAQWAELEVPLRRPGAVVLSFMRTTVRRTRRGAWIDRNYFCISRRNCCKTSIPWTYRPGLQESDVCTLLLTKSVLGLLDWIRAGYKGVGDSVPVPAGQPRVCLGLWVRRCKVGHSCMRRVIDCSSVPHKLAWRSVGSGLQPALVGPGAKILKFYRGDLLSTLFQELDTPSPRCCWRCGCSMSCVSLITADIDQAFEACSSSAV